MGGWSGRCRTGWASCPTCFRRKVLPFGYQSERPEPAVGPNRSVVQNGGSDAERRAGADFDAPDSHDAVLEQVRLGAGKSVELRMVPDFHAIKLGKIRGVEPYPPAYFCAEAP